MRTLLRLRKLFDVLGSKAQAGALFQERVLAATEHRPVLASDLRSIIDIGANRGQFALASRRWSPRATLVSFEPLQRPASTFRRIFAGDGQVRLIEAAVGPRSERATIHLSARDDSSSLLPIGALQSTLFPGTAEVGTEQIQMGRLSDFLTTEQIERPALLKIDVQGYELECLRGCEDLLPRFDRIYCECSFVELYSGQSLAGEVVQWLGERGFRLRDMFNPALGRGSSQIVQADFLFESDAARAA